VSATDVSRTAGRLRADEPRPVELLAVNGLNVTLGRGHRILHDVDLNVAAGEILGLIGETGSGKTTLARTVLGLLSPDSGTVRLNGVELTSLRGGKLRAFRRAGHIQYIFQDPLRSLDPDLRVADIVGEGLAIGGVPAADRSTRVRSALERVGLDPALANRGPGQISGGQRQRVAIARAIVVEPRLLICDEPVSALDVSNRNHILQLLADLRDQLGVGIVVISHDLGSLAAITDRIAVLYQGRIVEEGPARAIFTAPQHSYTQLLIASVPTIDSSSGIGADRRRELREQAAQQVGERTNG
jgi:ABC-type glutathione transport system ATPase component